MGESLGLKYNFLLKDVHKLLKPPTNYGTTTLIRGSYKYFHYKCDNFNDIGWGCAYRTLQSLCSWIINVLPNIKNTTIPTIHDIQKTLVNICDKPSSFIGSKEWIGALEIFYVVDTLYDLSCRIIHIPQSDDVKKYANVLKKYFEEFGGFVMMGGDIDASSKAIIGVHIDGNEAYFLIVDPHFVGNPKSSQDLIDQGFVRWQHTSGFVDSSFYNLCLPQVKAKSD